MYIRTDILLPAVGVSLLYIHCSSSTVIALLCIPVSELVSCGFSTFPIRPCIILHLLV